MISHLTVRLARLYEMSDAFLDSDVVVPDDRVAFLVLPNQIANVPSRDGQDRVASANTHSHWEGRTQQDVSVPGDDAAGHGGDEHIDGAGKQALARLFRRCERGYGRGEGGFKVQGLGQAAVQGVFERDGLGVQEETGLADLSGQTGGRTGKGAAGGRCGLRRDFGVEDGCRVDMLGQGF